MVDIADEDEAGTFVDLAAVLDDGEAASAAIAIHRGWRLATDVRKAIEVVGDRAELVGSLDLVRAWSTADAVAGFVLRDALQRVRGRGYVPSRAHPQRAWWDRALG